MSRFRPARENPFATEHLLRVPFLFDEQAIDKLCQKFDAMGQRASIIGPHGHGKTTLQEAIARHYQQRNIPIHWLRLSQKQPRFVPGTFKQLATELEASSIVFFDEAEQLSWWGWRRFLWALPNHAGCLITSHRAGLLPVLYHCQTSPALLQRIVRELPADEKWQDKSMLSELVEKHQGNLRLCLFDLYDKWAEDAAPRATSTTSPARR